MLTEAEKLDLDVLRDAVRYQQWVIDSFGPELNGSVLEIGSGTGNFTRHLSARAERLTALEPDPSLFRSLAALHLPGVTVVHGSIESFKPGDHFDSAVMINVLEHIEDDIGALRTARSWLEQRGVDIRLCARRIVLSSDPWTISIATCVGTVNGSYGLRWLPSGFRTGWVRHMNALGGLGWFVAGRILRVHSISIRTVALNERFIVPVGRRIERVIHPPFGQSLIAGARRTDMT